MSEVQPTGIHRVMQSPSLAEILADESIDTEILSEAAFARMLRLERKRTERSGRRFMIMLIELGPAAATRNIETLMDAFVHTLSQRARETDIKGWYKTGSIFGVIFTEIGDGNGDAIHTVLLGKVTAALHRSVSLEVADQMRITFHLYPDEGRNGTGPLRELTPFAEATPAKHSNHLSHLMKRVMDMAGSLCALALLSPLFLTIAVAIKLTSAGPILFRQERVGRYGRHFTFFKFRSMFVESDDSLHREYVTKFIKADCDSNGSTSHNTIFKLTNDPRVTAVGRLIRRTSLDELPQLWNVLRGEMSLVGPRPPIPYEVSSYDLWHKRRLAVKPGLTGLWQVHGRSRVPFDDMVRLDLKYARSWSLALDLKILLQTPWAVFIGSGAC